MSSGSMGWVRNTVNPKQPSPGPSDSHSYPIVKATSPVSCLNIIPGLFRREIGPVLNFPWQGQDVALLCKHLKQIPILDSFEDVPEIEPFEKVFPFGSCFSARSNRYCGKPARAVLTADLKFSFVAAQ